LARPLTCVDEFVAATDGARVVFYSPSTDEFGAVPHDAERLTDAVGDGSKAEFVAVEDEAVGGCAVPCAVVFVVPVGVGHGACEIAIYSGEAIDAADALLL